VQAHAEHPTEDTLELYSLGMLGEAETETLEEHLLICAECQDRLAETDDYVRHMRAAAAKLRAGKIRKLTWSAGRLSFTSVLPRPVWAAAALCCLLLLAWAIGVRTRSLPVNSPPVAVALLTARGAGDSLVAAGPRSRALLLRADVTGLSQPGCCDLEIVDARGRAVRRLRAKLEGDQLTAVVSGLDSGAYWVRAYPAGSRTELLREYALRVE
jgi:hypothetical protein